MVINWWQYFYVLSNFLRGSELYHYHQSHYNLASVDKLDFGATLNNAKMLDGRQNFSFNEEDITSTVYITELLRQHHMDSIIHLAMQPNVDVGLKNPASFSFTNIVGTQALLECDKHAVSGNP